MARFLKDTDYNKTIRQWIQNILTNGNVETLTNAEMAAQSEMETYLNARYDIAAIFDTAMPENERNRLIVMYLCDIALYHLHSVISPDMVPELRENRYKAAIQWCKDVNKGAISPPNLPLVDVTAPTTTNSFVTGGNDKYTTPDSRY